MASKSLNLTALLTATWANVGNTQWISAESKLVYNAVPGQQRTSTDWVFQTCHPPLTSAMGRIDSISDREAESEFGIALAHFFVSARSGYVEPHAVFRPHRTKRSPRSRAVSPIISKSKALTYQSGVFFGSGPFR